MTLSQAFASVVRRILRRTDTSVHDLSQSAGVPERTMYNIVSGEQVVNLNQVKQVANGLDTTAGKIVTEAEAELEGAG